MSCRTGSNSIVISLVQHAVSRRRLREQDEKTVKAVFHSLRKEGVDKITNGQGLNTSGDDSHSDDVATSRDPKAPADKAQVLEFLRDYASEVRNATTIQDNKKTRWLAKLDDAIHAARTGEVPDQATFYAWTRLRNEANKQIAASAHDERMERITPDTVTEEDIVAAIRYHAALQHELETIRQTRGWHGNDGSALEAEIYALQSQVAQVEEDCRTLVTVFDSTPQGRAKLQAGTSRAYDSVFPEGRTGRLASANITDENETPTVPLRDAVRQEQNARQRLKVARHAGSPKAIEQARKELQHARYALGHSVSEHPVAGRFATLTAQDLAQQSTWGNLLAGESTPEGKAVLRDALLQVYVHRLQQDVQRGRLTSDGAKSIHQAAVQASFHAAPASTQAVP